jgi:hypothetical protein
MYSARYFCSNLEFIDRFSLKPPISNLTEIRPVGAALVHAAGLSDMKPFGAFRDCHILIRAVCIYPGSLMQVAFVYAFECRLWRTGMNSVTKFTHYAIRGNYPLWYVQPRGQGRVQT